ncbi:MAG: radical SAM protein [Deltaproteobacteria bacterium]|nr:radical SAM protein [Deltaproteobacteria bacterium]
MVEKGRAQRAREFGSGVAAREAIVRMALLYPSPYPVAMSSLGYLQIYRLANARAGTQCERAMLPEPEARLQHERTRTPLFTLETGTPTSDFDVLAISHAYELEGAGIVTLLRLSGVEPRAVDRTPRDPLVVLGGPITFSNPLPYAPLADVVVLGEGEACLDLLLSRLEAEPAAARGSGPARRRLLDELAGLPGFFVPSIHGERLPPIAQADDAMLPAHSTLFTPDTELANMQLIEPERGCHRGCTFCVMRRSTNQGMRVVSMERMLSHIDPDVPRVGLVGAAVSDHPKIRDILRALIEDHGKQVGISSLRADRLDDRFVDLLARGGYRSMTVALDAPSERQRDDIEKNLKTSHVFEAARLAKAYGMRHLKIYVIVGLPGQKDDDLDELSALSLELKQILPVVLAVSPFIPKFHTPLADAPFAGERSTKASLDRLRRRLSGQVKLRGPGVREAYVEYRLAQGGFAHAEAVIAAEAEGGSLGAWVRALARLPERVRPSNFETLLTLPTVRRRYREKVVAS